MTIEVVSIPDQRRLVSWRRFVRAFQSQISVSAPANQRLVLRTVLGLIAIASIAGGDALLRSYKYYSRIIDARLASGYPTSRPGLYAASRSIRPGQNLSRQSLTGALRRAGYVESEVSHVWNGSFSETTAGIEIRPLRKDRSAPSVVQIHFDGNKITHITGDDLTLDSFELEAEVLSNDPSYKAGKRETLTYAEIPQVLVNAILAIEDQRFFEHSGVDPLGIARAIVRNASDDRVGQGGSTITQQLVKNTYLSPERTIRRKYSEAMLALALETRLSKQDIFALYCNEVYLGQRGALAARGVREAAQIYFGKDLKQISLNEAATIAGMIQGPTRYSPMRHAEDAQARRNIVLEAMVGQGFIDRQQADETAKQPVVVSTSTKATSLAPYFVDYVNRVADAAPDRSAEHSRIYTTVDLELQRLAEAALEKQLQRLDAVNKHRTAKPQAALVALDPKTGNVLAMVGGREYAESQLNRATDARRQPGSTFKPFVYAAALEDGMSPVQTFVDSPREFTYERNKTYRPANFGGNYALREVTMRTGLVKSLNVVTVDVALQTGLARIANLAQEFGLPRPERYPSLALGTKEVTPLELAAAYATLVNGGRRVKPKVIASVGEPPARHAIYEEPAQVVSPTTAYMITNMLSAVVDHGTARAARDITRLTAAAGKTGTSRDGWFVGYTPNLVCVVWIGYDDNQQLGLTGAEAALPAWVDFISGAVKLNPELGGKNFECPEGIKFVEIDAEVGALSTLSCPHRELIAVTERLSPNLECYLHGNLPEQFAPYEGGEQSAELPSIAQHTRSTIPTEPRHSRSAATAVNVEPGGRRTLINDLR